MFYGDASTPLRRWAEQHPAGEVRFTCCACGSGHDVGAARLVWLLKAFDFGDEETPVAAAARLDDHVCVRCGGTRWEAWPREGRKAR